MRSPFRPPGGDRTFNAVMFLGVGLWFFAVKGLHGDAWVSRLAGALLIMLGIGLWVWYSGVRWPAAIFLASVCAFNLFMMVRGQNFSWSTVFVSVGALWVAWGVIRDHQEKKEAEKPPVDEGRPFVSIVLLIREPRHMEAAILARQLSRAWGAEYVGHETDGPRPEGAPSPVSHVVVGATPLFAANASDGLYLIHNRPTPYVGDVEGAAATIPDARAREAVLKHKAWIAVDLKAPLAPARPVESYYPLIGRLVAELADEDSLAIFHPASLRISAWDPGVEAVLCGPEPLKAFSAPVGPSKWE